MRRLTILTIGISLLIVASAAPAVAGPTIRDSGGAEACPYGQTVRMALYARSNVNEYPKYMNANSTHLVHNSGWNHHTYHYSFTVRADGRWHRLFTFNTGHRVVLSSSGDYNLPWSQWADFGGRAWTNTYCG